MGIVRAVSAFQSRCSCRPRLVITLASSAGVSLHQATHTPQSSFKALYSILHESKPTTGIRRSELLQQSEGLSHDTSVGVEEFDDHAQASPNSSATVTTTMPWYLQVQASQHTSSRLAERQMLPDLPHDPPPLLQPIIEHLSVNVGVDNLLLLDIRKIDPPPALGANLLMLIGTARSEKHLHISADRFCRWLRTSHKLSPYADGLLGRNELKLKMRRKARRAKLLSSVGSSDDGNADDGIRTGWVCVNVGAIGNIAGAEHGNTVRDGFIGFGGQSEGVKLVVQMLTEQKREELDLEGLWGGVLARQQRKEAREAEKQQQEIEDLEVGSSVLIGRQVVTDAGRLVVHRLPALKKGAPSHYRQFHTNTRLYTSEDLEDLRTSTYNEVEWQSLEPGMNHPDTATLGLDDNSVGHSLRIQGAGQNVTLESHLTYLRSLSKENAIMVLGEGDHDRNSTSFLSSFYSHFPAFPDLLHWQCRFDLLYDAFKLGHSNYRKKAIYEVLEEMQSSGIEIPLKTFEAVLHLVLGSEDISQLQQDDNLISTVANVDKFLDLTSDMDLRSLHIFNESTLSPLLPYVTRMQYTADKREIKGDALWTLVNTLDEHGIYLQRSSSHYFILSALSEAGDWQGFWKYWRGIARRMRRKSFMLYALMFRVMAASGSQVECDAALRDWLPEMELEQPPVPLAGILARAVVDCLRVAEPDIDVRACQHTEHPGASVLLLRRCQKSFPIKNDLLQDEVDDCLLEHFQSTKR